LAAGAAYVIIDEKEFDKGDHCIFVDDVLTSLQELATYHRQQLQVPVVGITGTNGKTTTKELLHAVLSQKFKTFATKGNLNNHIGVPLSLLAIDDSYEMAVIEMGANHVGEIAFLSNIAQPTHGLITNVGKAHLEGFGSFEGVMKAKGELYDYIKEHGGVLFLQANNPYLSKMAESRKISVTHTVSYGFSELNDVFGELIGANPYLSISWNSKAVSHGYELQTNLTGSYNLENFLAAIAVGLHFGVESQDINRGLADYFPKNNRSQVTKTDRNTVIADFYNANASSMSAALDNMYTLDVPHKVIILGDMFELGAESHEEHAHVIFKAKGVGPERLIFVGKAFYKHRDEEAEYYESTDEAKDVVSSISDSFVLLKASRGMAFERLLDML
jgi:UDP-N-acetylmuramoyl-tripeptide--D-alanyl-D-alanine ligase